MNFWDKGKVLGLTKIIFGKQDDIVRLRLNGDKPFNDVLENELPRGDGAYAMA